MHQNVKEENFYVKDNESYFSILQFTYFSFFTLTILIFYNLYGSFHV